MKNRAIALTLIIMLVSPMLLPTHSAAEYKAADRYTIEFREGMNSHLDDLVRYGEFVVLYELLKTFKMTLSPGQDVSFTNDVSVPIELRKTNYSAGGQGSITVQGKVVPGFAGIPNIEGTIKFVTDITIIDKNSTLVDKEEIHIEHLAQFRLSLFNIDTQVETLEQVVNLNIGGLDARPTTTANKTSYYKDGRVVTSTPEGAIFGYGFMFKYVATAEHNKSAETQPKEDEEVTFTGTIVDYADRPMKHMEVQITAEGSTYKGTTDAVGYYSIKAEELEELPSKYTITTLLRYKKDQKEYFVLVLPLRADNYYFNVKKDVVVNSESDLHCEYVLSKNHPAQGFTPLIRKSLLDNITTVYHYMSQVVEYYESLNLYKDFNIPAVPVRCYDSSEGGTLYYPGRGIYIARPDMENSSPEAPHNREWHEYNHHVMYSIYGKWPEGVVDGYRVNHAGFVNASTADSYMEGFAEFMALVTGDYYDLGNGSIYAPIADMDLYYKPWEYRGQAEELSVAAILWKLYDGAYAKEVGSTLEKLWSVLQTYSKDFAEVYEKLVAAFPDRVGTVNALFTSHGFFQASATGNGAYDRLEPFIDQNNSRRYDAGEVFIDLPINDKGKIEVRPEADAKAGYAADAGRPDRRSPLSPAGHFIKTDNAVPYYTVEYAFIDHPELNYSLKTRNIDGYITAVVPPSEYITTVVVKPFGVAHDKPLSFSSDDFYQNYDQNVSQGSFIEHDFAVTGPVEPLVTIPADLLNPEWNEPLLNTDGEVVTVAAVTPTIKEPEVKGVEPAAPDRNTTEKTGSLLPVIVLAILATLSGVALVLFLRRGK